MVASPEICRSNGAKSRGAVTPRGKAIASRNSTKHGLLAKQPPILVTEDLETFEGLMQGLIEQYQPQTPIEHFLVQQVAMGMVKQYRLWNVEAAIANQEILKAQRLAKFPDRVSPAKVDLGILADYQETVTPAKDVLKSERDVLEVLILDLSHDLSQVKAIGQEKTLEAFRESMEDGYSVVDRSAPVWHYQRDLDHWLSGILKKGKKRSQADWQEAIERVNQVITLAAQRMLAINETIAEIEGIDQGITQAAIASKGLQNPELFSRYQRANNRELYEAIDRLEKIREQRQTKGSMGSFS